MRRPIVTSLLIAGVLGLSACAKTPDERAQRALKDLNVVDDTNMSDVMLTVGDPTQAVDYFSKASAANPTRYDLKRGLAKSLARANRPTEAIKVWREIAYSAQGTNEDRVGLADALIRTNDWKGAKTELSAIPPTYETYERYRLEAMVADANKQWKKADSFYETAFGLTTKPSGVLNNWGFSKLTRGDYAGAEKLFAQSLTYDPGAFTTKNNLVLARAGQHVYDMPLVEMTQGERAQLLYTAALTAVKQGDVATAKTLLQDAIDTSPQYFEQAVRTLKTLDATPTQG